MYVVFVEMVELQVEVDITPTEELLQLVLFGKNLFWNLQQTPNPTAHVPSELPPLVEHSELVKHVP